MSKSQTSHTVVVDVPVRVAYNQWTQFESFPQFMDHVESVQQMGDERAHFVVNIAGKRVEYDAKIVKQEPDREVVWRSENGKRNGGMVSFQPVDDRRTEVTLELMYEPTGVLEKVGDLIGLVSSSARRDLERFKTFIEARGAETGAWRGEIHEGPRH